MNKIIYSPFAGGLGDSLIASTLPERWATEQNTEVYVYDEFRNNGIRDAIWAKNPFVKGLIKRGDMSVASTKIMNDDLRLTQLTTKHGSNIKGFEAYFEFHPVNDYPKIYWEPDLNNDWKDAIVLDYNAVTAPFTTEQIESYVTYLHRKNVIDLTKIIVLNAQCTFGIVNGEEKPFSAYPQYTTKDIYEYASIIRSCGEFVTVSSGSSALASAIKARNPEEVHVRCLIHTPLWNKHIWKWNNLDYYITGSTMNDWIDI